MRLRKNTFIYKNRKGKLPTHDSTRHNPMPKYTLYRGTPHSGLDLDDLEGGGGRGHEMLGSGLYCTDEYHVAADYAQGTDACVYELELNIPNEEILEINPHTTNIEFLDIESANSIERDFFGLTAPAFILKIKDRNTGEDFTYLISEYEDVLEYEEDLKRAIATEIISQYGLYTSDYESEWDSDWGTWEIRDYLTEVFEAIKDPEMQDYPEVQAYSKHLESLKYKLSSLFLPYEDVEEHIIELLENEYIQKIRERHYPYYEDDTVLWGGDSTELAGIARQHGYKVLWCSDWISSGNEVLIVDDSIYNNGLVIVNDCSES